MNKFCLLILTMKKMRYLKSFEDKYFLVRIFLYVQVNVQHKNFQPYFTFFCASFTKPFNWGVN